MPITFATDLKDLEKFDYVEQIPVEALFKNLGYKQARYDQAAKEIKSELDPLWNIPAYGVDAKRKAEIIQKYNDHLRSYAGKDLGSDQAARAALESDISQMSNDFELSQINQRGLAKKAMDAKYRELTKDGSSIASHNLEGKSEQDAYFNGDQYDPNKAFSRDIYKNFDFNKLFDDAVTKSPKWDEMKKAPNGQQQYFAGQATSQIQSNIINDIKSNPAAMREKWAEFDHKYAGTDWSKNDIETSKAQLDRAESLFHEYNQLANSETDPALKKGYEDQAREAQKHGQFWANFATAAKIDPNMAKKYAFDDEIASNAYDIAVAHTNYALKEQKTNDLYMQESKAALDRVSDKQSTWYQAAADRGNISLLPNAQGYGDVNSGGAGNIPAKPSGKTVKTTYGEFEAPYIVESIENSFDPSAKKTDFLKQVIADKYGIKPAALKMQMKLNPDGTLHFYIPTDETKPDDDSKENIKSGKDFGTYDKSTIYSMIPAQLNKEAEAYRQNSPVVVIGNKSFPKVVNNGITYPIVTAEADSSAFKTGQKYVVPDPANTDPNTTKYLVKTKS
jgi:hypothetical protein